MSVSEPWTAQTITTAVIAGIALLLSAVSICWQAATWKLSGPRVKVELRLGSRRGINYATIPASADWRAHFDEMGAQGATDRMFAVEVRNVGRQATSIVGYAAETDTGVKTGTLGAPPGLPKLPHRLEADSQILYFLDLADVVEVLALAKASNKEAKTVRMSVALGSGKTKSTEAVSAPALLSLYE